MTSSQTGALALPYNRVVQLGHVISVGMPRPPLHPPYMFSMSMSHDWTPAKASPITGTADSIAMGTHVGTHVDSIFHIARGEPPPRWCPHRR